MNTSFSQVIQEWAARYSQITQSNDGATSVVTDLKGNLYVSGGSLGIGTESDFVTIKYNSYGNQQWVKTYNGPGNGQDIVTAMCIDNSGNIVVTGSSENIGSQTDILTIKYDSSGSVYWIMRYSCSGNSSYPTSLVTDISDNIYLTGRCSNNLTTIKYTYSGVEEWVAQYPAQSLSDVPWAIAIDHFNNLIISGENSSDCITIKYNSNGDRQWTNTYSGVSSGQDFAFSIDIDSLNNIYISGSSIESPNLYGGYLTIKYNANGIQQWVRIYEGSGNFFDIAKAMKVDKQGNVYVTGYSTESGQGYNMTTIKYNTEGDTLWKSSYNNGLNDISYAMALDTIGNIYITGQSDGSGTADDYATIKYDSNGVQQWVKRYNYSGQFGDYAQAIAVDNIGSVYVTGSSNRDYLTIKYSQPTGINSLSSSFPKEYLLQQNFPNPFNPETIIKYALPQDSRRKTQDVKIIVHDVTGREILTLVNEKQNTGSYEVEFDGNNFPSGIYFYRLQADGVIVDTKRMVLLK